MIYKLLNCLIDNGIHFAMWYDTYVEKLDICNTKDEVLETCYKQIMDKSGMCEIYIVFNIDKSRRIKEMNGSFRITEDELLSEKHFPVKAIFNMVKDYRFKEVVEGISNNSGFGENYGACVFWNDLDDYDKQNTPFYEGAEFGLHNGEEVIIDAEELLYYLNLVCDKYCKDHIEDKEIIWEYVNKYKRNNNL